MIIKYKIGFDSYSGEQTTPAENKIESAKVALVKSVVQVRYPEM